MILESWRKNVMKKLFCKYLLKFIIEIKRKIMYKKAKDLGYTHPQVVNCSQKLDQLLNKYSDYAC